MMNIIVKYLATDYRLIKNNFKLENELLLKITTKIGYL